MIELPTLYAMRLDGKIKQWCVHTENDVVVMTHGSMGGKQTESRTRSLATNRGRSNERLGPEQAVFESQAAWQKKKDEGYFESVDAARTTRVFKPMLAHSAYVTRTKGGVKSKELRPLKFPMHAQRKLNGLRCLATNKKLVSREGIEWNLPHIQVEVAKILKDGEYLDGEVYIHGVPLQTLNSLIKDYRAPESLALQFHVYDFPQDNAVWVDRYDRLRTKLEQYRDVRANFVSSTIQMVDTVLVDNMGDIAALENVAVELEGYEGLILRQWEKPYVWAGRCDSLLKWKRFTDMEFLIIDVLGRELIKGKESTWICDKFVCQNNMNDHTFEVVPKGTEATRAEYFKNKDQYIGQRLMVRFLERSVDGIPQGNPVGSFRLPEDTPGEETEEWTS